VYAYIAIGIFWLEKVLLASCVTIHLLSLMLLYNDYTII
jgi:hypothetical protein